MAGFGEVRPASLLPWFEGKSVLQFDFRGGAADEDVEVSRLGVPRMFLHMEKRERVHIQLDRDALDFTGLQIYLGETL